eukprot:scaffold208989_cov26-Attheya_sp.AAC.1
MSPIFAIVAALPYSCKSQKSLSRGLISSSYSATSLGPFRFVKRPGSVKSSTKSYISDGWGGSGFSCCCCSSSSGA